MGILIKQVEVILLFESLFIVLDWINGCCILDVDQLLKSVIIYLLLGIKVFYIFKVLVYVICFGVKKIVECFEEEGVEIWKVIGIGGVVCKLFFIM